MPGRINSQPLGVITLYDALSITVDITVTGNNSGTGLGQWYYANMEVVSSDDERYSPNRAGAEPITLHPVIKAVDPETRQQVTPRLQTITWTEISGGGTRRLLGRWTGSAITGMTDYAINADGSLIVRKNVPYNAQVSIECVIEWTDPRTGDAHTDSVTVNLKTNLAAEEEWSIEIEKVSQRWNPLSGMSSTFTVTAKALLGKTDKSEDVRFFWYYIHNNAEVLIENNPTIANAVNPLLSYVSGQYTSTLTLDAEYETEKLTLVCRIGTGENPQSPNVANVYRYAHILWSMPMAEGNAYSKNGDTARQSIPEMEFGVLVQSGGTKVADAILESRTRTHWKGKRDSASTVNDLGWGRTVTVSNDTLLSTNGARYVVTPEIYVLTPYKAVTQGGTVLTQEIGGVQKVIVSKFL